MHPFVRRVISTCLPESIVQRLRRWHAPRVAARFRDADWPYAEFVRSVVQPGDTVIDVGANMGYITARLADYVGPEGHVIAIEPIPDTFAALQATVLKLDLSQVQAIQACVSSRSGPVEMEIPADSVGAENYYESSIIDPSCPVRGRRVTVPAIPLDSLLSAYNEERTTKNEQRITFIKIDVEGHELAVVQGAQLLLATHRPVLLIEVSGDPDDADSPAAQLFAFLQSSGYRPFLLEASTLRPRHAGDRAVDYVFCG